VNAAVQTPLGQSPGAMHSTHAGTALQTLAPAAPLHAEPGAFGVCCGDVPEQLSSVQSFASFWTSVASACPTICPAPSQTCWVQSPAVCVETTKPAVVG
jgi:hypothetical protein